MHILTFETIKIFISMNNYQFILLSLFLFTACKKDNNSDLKSAKNTVTYTTDGKTYTVNESKRITMYESTFVDSYVYKSDDFTSFHLNVEGENLPFEIGLDIDGPLSGIGTYTDVVNGWVKEKYSGGQGYDIIDATVTISSASNTKILGTYSFQLKSSSSTKSATGSFIINAPAQ
jgi:hypothetical protein